MNENEFINLYLQTQKSGLVYFTYNADKNRYEIVFHNVNQLPQNTLAPLQSNLLALQVFANQNPTWLSHLPSPNLVLN